MITKIPERVDLWRRFGSKKKSRDSAHLLASCPHPPLPPSPFPSLHFLIIFFLPTEGRDSRPPVVGEDLAVAVVPKGDTPRFRTSTPKRLAWGTHPTPWSAHPRRSLATDPHQEQPQGQVHAPTCVGKNRGRLFVGDDILGGQEWMDGPTTPFSSLQHRFVHVARGGMDLRGGASPQGPHAFNACHAYMQPPCMSGSILQGGGVICASVVQGCVA